MSIVKSFKKRRDRFKKWRHAVHHRWWAWRNRRLLSGTPASDGRKLVIVTGSDTTHFRSLFQFLGSAALHEKDAKVVVWDLGLQAFEREAIASRFPSVQLRRFPFGDHPEWMDIRKAAGQYAWKPVIVATQCREAEASGEILLWLDAGCLITEPLLKIRAVVSAQGFHSPYSANRVGQWTHPDALRRMGVGRWSGIRRKENLNGACLAFDCAREDVRSLVAQWERHALDKGVIAPEGSSRKNHRQDQSLITVLAYARGFSAVVPPFFLGFRTHCDLDAETWNPAVAAAHPQHSPSPLPVASGTRIGIFVIATHRYIKYVQPLLDSAEKWFMPGHPCTVFLFTDQLSWRPARSGRIGVETIPMPHMPFPGATHYRYHEFLRIKDKLAGTSHVFYVDADMTFMDAVGDECLGDGVTATLHPFFHAASPAEFSYERDPRSAAFIPSGQGTHYFCGGFNGGRTADFLGMAKEIVGAVDRDDASGIIAEWHDESHLNCYLASHPPAVVLSPAYCFPENCGERAAEIRRLFGCRLMALDKPDKAVVRGV